MRYASARYHDWQRDRAYRIYVSDCLRILTENTARSVAIQSGGKSEATYLTSRYIELISEQENGIAIHVPEEARRRIVAKLKHSEGGGNE